MRVMSVPWSCSLSSHPTIFLMIQPTYADDGSLGSVGTCLAGARIAGALRRYEGSRMQREVPSSR